MPSSLKCSPCHALTPTDITLFPITPSAVMRFCLTHYPVTPSSVMPSPSSPLLFSPLAAEYPPSMCVLRAGGHEAVDKRNPVPKGAMGYSHNHSHICCHNHRHSRSRSRSCSCRHCSPIKPTHIEIMKDNLEKVFGVKNVWKLSRCRRVRRRTRFRTFFR